MREMLGERERKKRREENRGVERGEGRRGWGKNRNVYRSVWICVYIYIGFLRKVIEEERGVIEIKRSYGEAVFENGYFIN